jgi:hypothetical protein
MHFAAGRVTAIFRAARSPGKALRDIHLRGLANALGGVGVFSGAVEFEKPLRHGDNRQEHRCRPRATDKTFVQSVDAQKCVVLLLEPEQSIGKRFSIFDCFLILQLNRDVAVPVTSAKADAAGPEWDRATRRGSRTGSQKTHKEVPVVTIFVRDLRVWS